VIVVASVAATHPRKEFKGRGDFDEVRSHFLQKFGQQIRQSLGCILQDVDLTPVPLARPVQKQFLDACSSSQAQKGGLPGNLQPAIHGTNSNLFESIFERGLLIPGKDNELRVIHGSACGLGIYTTKPESAATSRSYCNVPRMLVCGVLDTDGPEIAHFPWGRVIFDARLVAPLFEASSKSWFQAAPVATVRPRVPLVNAVATSAAKTKVPKAAVAVPVGVRAFLARRAAQRRRS